MCWDINLKAVAPAVPAGTFWGLPNISDGGPATVTVGNTGGMGSPLTRVDLYTYPLYSSFHPSVSIYHSQPVLPSATVPPNADGTAPFPAVDFSWFAFQNMSAHCYNSGVVSGVPAECFLTAPRETSMITAKRWKTLTVHVV